MVPLLFWVAAGVALTLDTAHPALANGGQGHDGALGVGSAMPLVVAGVAALGIGAVILLLYAKFRKSAQGPLAVLGRSEYVATVLGFSRNAKLLLARSAVSGLSTGPWALLFNLYLLAVGFDPKFVAMAASLNWLSHGLFVIPAGIISDLFGRRQVFLLAFTISLVLRAGRVATLDPTTILVLSAVGGMAEGFHAITGSPFMTEQTRPHERVHMFTLSAVFFGVSMAVGNWFGGRLPVWLAAPLGVEGESFVALRAALLVSLAFGVVSMVPIYLIKEQWRVISIKSWFAGLTSMGTMAKLTLTQGLEAVALGMVVTFFNVMFATQYGASTAFIGTLFATTTMVAAGFTLLTPLVVKRLGQVRALTGIQLTGLPFLIAIVSAPNMMFASGGYVMRQTFAGAGFEGTGGMGAPIERLWPMLVVNERERGTTEGLMHSFREFPMAIGAAMAGPMMARGQWNQIYLIAAGWFAASFLAFYFFFRPMEVRMTRTAAAVAGGSEAGNS